MKTYKTPKGTVLPLINLKGKDYMMTAYRLQWFVEENPRYSIQTEFVSITPDETVARVTINLFNTEGILVKTVQGTKRESKKDFNDHTEKSETGALGRALISLGYGTQYALADLDEGDRIVDSPVVDVREPKYGPTKLGPKPTATVEELTKVATDLVKTQGKEEVQKSLNEVKKSSFRKPRAVKTEVTETPVLGNGSTKEEDFFGN